MNLDGIPVDDSPEVDADHVVDPALREMHEAAEWLGAVREADPPEWRE